MRPYSIGPNDIFILSIPLILSKNQVRSDGQKRREETRSFAKHFFASLCTPLRLCAYYDRVFARAFSTIFKSVAKSSSRVWLSIT